jgi:hypothetical protein
MLISPIQFNNFTVGPFSYSTEVRPDEDASDAMDRAYEVCRAAAEKSYAQKLKMFQDAYRASNARR